MKGKVAVPNKPTVSVDVEQHFEKPHQALSPGMVWTIDLCTGPWSGKGGGTGLS